MVTPNSPELVKATIRNLLKPPTPGTPEPITAEYLVQSIETMIDLLSINTWRPKLALVPDGSRVVMKVIDWEGGIGPKPDSNLYIGSTGLVALVTNAIDLRGDIWLNWRGAWLANTQYAVGDGVTNLGSTYRRKSAGTSGATFEPANWDIIALAGSVADGTVTTPKIADLAITLSKTAFSKAGKNLFNKATTTDSFYLDPTNNGAPVSSATYFISDFIKVTAGQTYYGWDGSLGMRFIVCYNASKVQVAGGSTASVNSFLVPAGVDYVRITATMAGKNTFQFEQNTVATTFEAYGLYIDPAFLTLGVGQVLSANIADNAIGSSKLGANAVTTAKLSANAVTNDKIQDNTITPGKLSFVIVGKNKFNVNDGTNDLGHYMDAGGFYGASASYNLTHFIPVLPNTWYYPTVLNRVVFFDANKNYLSGDYSRSVNKFQTPANTAYVRYSVPVGNWNTFQLELGETATAFEAYNLILSGVGAGLNDQSVTSSKLADLAVTKAKIGTAAVSSDKVDFLIPGGKNLFNKLTTGPDGFYIDATGFVGGNAIYCYSDYISVVPGLTYTGTNGTINMRFVCFYDANKVVVAGGYSAGVGVTTFTVPNTGTPIAFVRVSIQLAIKNTFQFEQAAARTSYEPYLLLSQTPGGTPIAPSYIPSSLIQSVLATVDEPIGVCIAPKLYIPTGKEIAVYVENIHKYFPAYRDKTDLIITGGTQTGRVAKLKPVATGTVSAAVTVGNKSFDTILTKAFSVIATDASLTTAKKILDIGDSYTLRSTFVNSLIAGAGTGITFLGIRNSTASTGFVKCEGRGGWSMSSYVNLNKNLYSPFMQPLAGSYLYLGNTDFWQKANAGLSDAVGQGYDYNRFNVANQFNTVTGYPITPRANDVIYDNGLSLFKTWDGSAWQTITEATLNFGISFAKYRTCWGIDQPDIIHIMLGTNDFAATTETTFPAAYTAFKTGYDALIASIKADSPSVKIILAIPVSSGRQGEFGTLTTERRKRSFWMLANNMITDYAGREAENLYLNDYHSCVDRVYGYDNGAEKPFDNYTGTWREDYKADSVHLGLNGFAQEGDRYYGLIQALR